MFRRKTKFSDLLKEHPEALLASHHPIDFVHGNAKLQDIVKTYTLPTLLRNGFSLQHLDAMATDQADTLACLYRAYGVGPCNSAFEINALQIKDRCRNLQSLLALDMSVEEIKETGLNLDIFMKRGATLADLLTVPLYKDMDSSDSSFAEFSVAWGPTQSQLENLGCTEQELVENITEWDFASIPQRTLPAEPCTAQSSFPVDSSHLFRGLKLNF